MILAAFSFIRKIRNDDLRFFEKVTGRLYRRGTRANHSADKEHSGIRRRFIGFTAVLFGDRQDRWR